MIITYALHKGYTVYRLPDWAPRNIAVEFEQLTGYHPSAHQARLAASGFQGTVTGRFSSSRPEFQDPNHKHKPTPLVTSDFSDIEHRTLAHYSQEMTATQAAELRDKFNEAYPRVKQFWESLKNGVAAGGIPRRMLDEPEDTPEFQEYLTKLKARTGDMEREAFESLYMQSPLPVDDIRAIDPDDKGPMAALEDDRKLVSGRRDDLDLSERASRDPTDPRRRPK